MYSAKHRRLQVRIFAATVAAFALVACSSGAPVAPSPAAAASSSQTVRNEVMASCRVPGRCGQPLSCEGDTLSLVGKVDPTNIFDHTSAPNLPFQKFLVRNTSAREPIEVWVVSASPVESQQIFRRVRSAAATNVDVTVVGRAVGVDLQITGACNRAVRLEINTANDVTVSGGAMSRVPEVSKGAAK